MSLVQIVEKEDVNSIRLEEEPQASNTKKMLEVYSPKLGECIPLYSGNPKGEIQKYNLGIGPGSWY